MKNLFFPLFALLLFCRVSLAQNYVPLQLDSFYSFYEGISPKNGGLDTQILFAAYSYSNDTLIQLRQPYSRTNYFYVADTVIKIDERNFNSPWYPIFRTTKIFSNGVSVSSLVEKFTNNAWVNATREFKFYDANNHDTLTFGQNWQLDEWVNRYKIIKTFNSSGKIVGQGTYYTNSDGIFYLSNGLLYEYDNASHLVQKTEVKNDVSWPTYGQRYKWDYGGDNLVDTYTVSAFTNGAFEYVSKSVYDYINADSTIKNTFYWTNNFWRYDTKEVVFNGPGVYSGVSDSIHMYRQYEDEPEALKEIRHTYYSLLDDDKVYFVSAALLYFPNFGQWRPYYKREEWYHVRASVNNDEVPASKNDIAIFPNPCQRGQTVSLRNGPQEHFDVLLFNVQGQLVSSETGARETGFRVPDRSGTYMVLFRTKDRMLGVSKLIVSD